MNLLKKSTLAFALALVTLAPLPASAVPAVAKPVIVDAQATPIDVVYRGNRGFRGNRNFRGNRGYRGNNFYGRNRNRGIGAGAIVGGVIASALIASAIRENRASSGDIERCEDNYKSFDRRSGTYLNYDGNRHVCPYLN